MTKALLIRSVSTLTLSDGSLPGGVKQTVGNDWGFLPVVKLLTAIYYLLAWSKVTMSDGRSMNQLIRQVDSCELLGPV